MKRYRVTGFDFDRRALVLSTNIEKDWDQKTKALWKKNIEITKIQLLNEFGPYFGEKKIDNFVDLGPSPVSIVAFHNKFFTQIRNAFVMSSYYPALTGACALGERILNHIILKLKDFYKNTPEYKKVYNKSSFENWDLAIDTLRAWQILLPKVVKNYKKLAEIRHKKAIHFNPETDYNDRDLALGAIKLLSKIIGEQFSGFGNQPWFIPEIPGKSFIKKKAESQPFINEIYIPNCELVGPYHKVEIKENRFVIIDEYNYPQREISDKEFARLLRIGPLQPDKK